MQAFGWRNLSSQQKRVHSGQKAYVETCMIAAYSILYY